MAGQTEQTRTDDGLHLVRFAIVGEVHVTRRDDLRGVWEVDGDFYATKGEAIARGEDILDEIEASQQ